MFKSRLLKIARPVDIDASVVDKIFDYVLTDVQRSIQHCPQDRWDHQLKIGVGWRFNLEGLLQDTEFSPIILEFHIDNQPPVETPHVIAAGVKLEGGPPYLLNIKVSNLTMEQRSELPEFLLQDIWDSLLHEMTHVKQKVIMRGDYPNKKIQNIYNNPNADIVNYNIESKALSTELSHELMKVLQKNPNMNIEAWLSNNWKWKQLRGRLDKKHKDQILKDLWQTAQKYKVSSLYPHPRSVVWE